jgi:gliding motility-associated-like protein
MILFQAENSLPLILMKLLPRTPLTILILFILPFNKVNAQNKVDSASGFAKTRFIAGKDNDLFGKRRSFITNIGQYGEIQSEYPEMGKILYGYEGFDMPVLFTAKGLIHLQRKFIDKKNRKDEYLEKEEEIKPENIINRTVVMQWEGANPNPRIVEEKETSNYFTYGLLPGKSKAFKKITFENLYPGIDLIYSFKDELPGFEFSLLVKPGADLNRLKFSYTGDVRSMKLDKNKNLVIKSEIGEIKVSKPIGFYATGDHKTGAVNMNFRMKKNQLNFELPEGYDHTKPLMIDPFITNINFGTNIPFLSLMAKDIDYDEAGNVYVSGGGDVLNHLLAKLSPTGVLLWTFNGTVSGESWKFGPYYGGWGLNRSTGETYLGQGRTTNGTRIIRLNSSGIYDNYISDSTPLLKECWRIICKPNGGNTKLYIGGGGENTMYSLGLLSPPSTVLTPVRLSTFNTFQQDVSDMVIDSTTNQLYCLFSSNVSVGVRNKIFKYNAPFQASNHVWTSSPPFMHLFELSNRPYLATGSPELDNSSNTLALSKDYLIYSDANWVTIIGKSNGAIQTMPFSTGNPSSLLYGGIVVDGCNNLFLGVRDTIKVYRLNGTSINDNGAPDIDLNLVWRTLHDLAYDPNTKMLYACGYGFVASIDVSAYSPASNYSVTTSTNCTNSSVNTTLSPTLAQGATATYSLYEGPNLISSNQNGTFANLSASSNYYIKVNFGGNICGEAVSPNFMISGLDGSVSITNACQGNSGTITASGINGTAPYVYSLDGGNFTSGNIFTGLPAGNYQVTIKDANNCVKSISSVISNNCFTVTISTTNTQCTSNNGSMTITAAGGTAPYSYSLDGINFQSGNLFDQLYPGAYTITVKDATGMVKTFQDTVQSDNNIQAAAVVTAATCLANDGLITITSSETNLQYSINGIDFLTNNSFNNLAPGDYTILVKNALGCQKSISAQVPFNNNLTIDLGPDKTICEGKDVSMTATSNGTGFVWSPALGLNSTTILNPLAGPNSTTKYYASAILGSCTAIDSIMVVVNPAPVANAGADVSICYGNHTQLSGTGGTSYLWSPYVYLDLSNVPDPIVIEPPYSMTYALHVKDQHNCMSLYPDSVLVTVLPPLQIFAGNDTSVIVNQPTQLNALDLNGNQISSYLWSPISGLNNPFIQNPVATLNAEMQYTVTAQTIQGCQGKDTIRIKVFEQTNIQVPSAFSPNGDGKNDVLQPILVGIKEFKYFIIYNRLGDIVFQSNQASLGWDGKFKHSDQGSFVFIWIAMGIDVYGQTIQRKGTVTIIR